MVYVLCSCAPCACGLGFSSFVGGLKMADCGPCTGEALSSGGGGGVVVVVPDDQKQRVDQKKMISAGVVVCEGADVFFSNSNNSSSGGVDLCCGAVSAKGHHRRRHRAHEDTDTDTVLMDINMPLPANEDDCRKKRCVDRYDSSESSDSGVAILSCTDCSGSSTASSDITDPGSPFSTASSHSEDSGSQPVKMPPTQNAHHPTNWLWTDEQPTLKRTSTPNTAKPAFSKRAKTNDPTPKCLNNNTTTSKNAQKDKEPPAILPKLQQGKITEYFKSQYKSPNCIKKDPQLSNIVIKSKVMNLVESSKKIVRVPLQKTRSVPRKILPAPEKIKPITTTINTFPPIITTLIPNVAYIQTKAPKPPDNNIFLTNTIPIVNLQTLPILNPAAVVPIVKLNMPSKSYNFNVINAAVPTAAKVEVSAGLSIESRECLVEEMSPADSGVSSSSSTNSLEVNVEDLIVGKVEEEQKSPILSQPKTIRFPAKERTEAKEKIAVNTDTATCQWDQCAAQFDTNGALLEHLQVKHVISQATQEQYVCLWQGCKVHGRKSCSRSWLERHVLAHAGSKPFRCIVDGCGQRFNSQLALERHVNNHFNTESSQNGSTKKSVENGSVKLFRRNGKKIRFRRQPWSARMFDFMDSGIMEGLQYKLLSMTEKRTLGKFDSTEGDMITLESQVLAKRVEQDGTSKMLLRWHPADVVEDEWVSEKDVTATKTVSIRKLEPVAKDSLKPVLFPPISHHNHNNNQQQPLLQQKHRRKFCKST